MRETETGWRAEFLSDPSAPYWAKDLVRALAGKDPVDVVNVLEYLAGRFGAELVQLQSR